jgi:hypothetical protein
MEKELDQFRFKYHSKMGPYPFQKAGIKMHKLTYLLDGISGTTLIGGIVTGHGVLAFLGGAASFMAFVNHYQQWKDRKRNKKEKI